MNWKPNVDVVVPCYNVAHIVADCAKSLLKLDYPKDKLNLYFVDDGSSDNTAGILSKYSFDHHVHILTHKTNRGLSAARNTGIKAGGGEIIFFLDSDMTVSPYWVQDHLITLKKPKTVGIIGDSCLPPHQKPNSLDKYLYNNNRGARKFRHESAIRFPYFLFNNTSVRRFVFDVIELFDEKIKTYGGEDTELAIRLWEAYPDGLKYSALAVSTHHHQRKLQDFIKLMFLYGKTNLPLLLEAYPNYAGDLGGDLVFTVKGYLIFNPIVRRIVENVNQLWINYWLTRYIVIDAVIRGARSTPRG